MAQLNKIDSNVTELRYAEEASYKTLPGTPTWVPLEPNSYTDFGGQITTVARNPINSSRQRKKGVVTDLDASGAFDTDLTQTNMQDLLQGFMFADLRTKVEFGGAGEITNVDGVGNDYEAASGLDAFSAGDLVFASGFTNADNNGLKRVTAAAAASLTVAETVVNETPPAGATLVQVGFQAAADDLNIDVTGSLPKLTSDGGIADFTVFNLIPGEALFLGGDSAATQFSASSGVNNGLKRIRLVETDGITFDKSTATMVAESLSGGETIQFFFGRVLKNELGSSIVRRTYNLERTLGAPDDALPAQIQSEYITGAVPNEFTFNIATADKLTCELSFVGADSETRTGATGVKSGNRPSLVEMDAFNTSSDFSSIKMAQVVAGDEAPTPLFAFVTDLTININNNATPNKAVGTLGAFEVTTGTFEVGGELTAYFGNVTAVQAVRDNADITLSSFLVKANAGINIDIPLITLGDGRPDVSQDEAITLPLNMAAATGAKIDSNLDHTLLITFFDYLPDAADL